MTFLFTGIVRPLSPSPMTRVSLYSHTTLLSSLFSLSSLKLSIYSKIAYISANITDIDMKLSYTEEAVSKLVDTKVRLLKLLEESFEGVGGFEGLCRGFFTT